MEPKTEIQVHGSADNQSAMPADRWIDYRQVKKLKRDAKFVVLYVLKSGLNNAASLMLSCKASPIKDEIIFRTIHHTG